MSLLYISLLTVFLYSLYIRLFKKNTQYERELGLESHKIKNGTITMGGIIFVIVPLFFIIYDIKTINIVFTIVLYSLLGFVDDLLIVIKKNNNGLNPTLKFVLQIIIAAISFYLYLNSKLDTTINIFNHTINLKWLYGVLILFVLTASTNAFNIVDGVDGLCAGLSLFIAIFFMIVAYKKHEFNIFYMLVITSIPIFIFWCFNYPKAFLFMGDTGSLYLGAYYGILSLYLDCLIPFIFVCSLFIFETFSVILQVTYFKLTKGKRIFKMAPFHHHLEALGIKEIYVDLLFYIIQILLVIIGLIFI